MSTTSTCTKTFVAFSGLEQSQTHAIHIAVGFGSPPDPPRPHRLPMHEKRCYVKPEDDGYRSTVKRLPPLCAAVGLALSAATADASEIPGSENIPEAAYFAGDRPSLAFVRGRELHVATLADGWSPRRVAVVPGGDARLAALRDGSALIETRAGAWLRYYERRRGAGWRAVRIADAPKDGQLGPAGMTLNKNGRPVISYSLRRRDNRTELWLAQVGRNLKVVRTRVTRRGFPASSVPPPSSPVLMPDGRIRIVQTFTQRGANAIFWRREGARWWGRVLYASALGASGFPFATALSGADLYLAWTIAYPTQRELHVVLTSRTTRSTSIVVHRNAIAAGLVHGPNGAEVAANESVAGLPAGQILFPSVLNSSVQASPPVEFDGRIVAYARNEQGWHLLIARNGRLEWFQSAEVPRVRIFQESGLTGRVEGAAGGVVRVYRERAGEPRTLVVEVAVGSDGRFAATDPAPVSGTRYRFVYEAEFPYALLVRESVP
jgi:hypothetical protein